MSRNHCRSLWSIATNSTLRSVGYAVLKDGNPNLKEYFWKNLDDVQKANRTVASVLTNRLERFNHNRTDLVFLWLQMRVAQDYADKCSLNKLSDFSVGAAFGQYIQGNSRRIFAFAAGTNSESDSCAIARHGEGGALATLEAKLRRFVPTIAPHIDLVVVSSSPCGACRSEIFTNGHPDTLVITFNPDNTISQADTIGNLFPIHENTEVFKPIKKTQIPKNLLRKADGELRLAQRSRYEGKTNTQNAIAVQTRTSLFGIPLKIIFGGHSIGDNAFWSLLSTHSILAPLTSRLKENDVIPVNAVCYSFADIPQTHDGKTLFFPSGRDRQVLTRLPKKTKVYFHINARDIYYETTIEKLIPGAFTV